MRNFDVVGVAGDWHSDTVFAMKCMNAFVDAGVTEVLHVGDFNFWNDAAGSEYLNTLNGFAGEHGMTLWVTEGNHEDFVMISGFVAHPEFDGWVYSPQWENILVAVRGARWEWNGVTFVSLGGANSINRFSLTPNVNWWPQEQISLGDVYRTIEGGHAEIMICHDSPAGVPLFKDAKGVVGGWSYEALAYASGSRDQLRIAVDAVKPEILFHGHYHFYNDQMVTLPDWAGTDYTFRNIGLDMNGKPNNIGVLTLPDKVFTTLEV